MPIYEYRCDSCGHQQEFMQKLSDPPHTTCPKCHKPTLSKMVTAAGFQLKGSGWYATDFKSKGTTSKPAEAGGDKKDGGAAKDSDTKKSDAQKGDGDASKASAACGAGACAACQ